MTGDYLIAQDKQWGSNRPDVRWMAWWWQNTGRVLIIKKQGRADQDIWRAPSNWEAT